MKLWHKALTGAAIAFILLTIIGLLLPNEVDWSAGSPANTGLALGKQAHQHGLEHPDAVHLRAMAREHWPNCSEDQARQFQVGFEFGWDHAD